MPIDMKFVFFNIKVLHLLVNLTECCLQYNCHALKIISCNPTFFCLLLAVFLRDNIVRSYFKKFQYLDPERDHEIPLNV